MEALLDTVRMSAPSASSAPPPSATPSTAAMTGTGSAARLAMMPRTASPKRIMSGGACPARSFRSAPAQNAPVQAQCTP